MGFLEILLICYGGRSHNVRPPDNHLSGLSISLSSLALSWVYRLPFFKSFGMNLWLEITTFCSGGENRNYDPDIA